MARRKAKAGESCRVELIVRVPSREPWVRTAVTAQTVGVPDGSQATGLAVPAERRPECRRQIGLAEGEDLAVGARIRDDEPGLHDRRRPVEVEELDVHGRVVAHDHDRAGAAAPPDRPCATIGIAEGFIAVGDRSGEIRPAAPDGDRGQDHRDGRRRAALPAARPQRSRPHATSSTAPRPIVTPSGAARPERAQEVGRVAFRGNQRRDAGRRAAPAGSASGRVAAHPPQPPHADARGHAEWQRQRAAAPPRRGARSGRRRSRTCRASAATWIERAVVRPDVRVEGADTAAARPK